MSHFSSIETAKLFEELLDLEQFHLVQPYIRLTEQAEAEGIANQHQEDNMVAAQTPGNIASDDFDTASTPVSPGVAAPPPGAPVR
jgi:uncharacterized circularly permuted ATP-grasp superfamily protein